MPSSTPRTFVRPLANSVRFSPLDPNGLTDYSQVSYEEFEDLNLWMAQQEYVQKIEMDDPIVIQASVQNGSSGVFLYILDKYQNEITTITLNLVAPYFKGWQAITGNNWVNPSNGAVIPLFTGCWAFKFSDFPADIIDGECYFIRCDNVMSGEPTISYISEPISVKTKHPDTQLYRFTYNSNVARKNIIMTGWVNDFPFFSDPYSPVFSIRCESYIIPTQPKGVNIGYLQQSYRQLQVKTDQISMRTLKIGEVSLGIPYYMVEMVTSALLSDKLTINGYMYILYNPSSQTQPADVFKMRDSEIAPLVFGSTTLALVSEAQLALANNIDPFGGIFTGEFNGAFT